MPAAPLALALTLVAGPPSLAVGQEQAVHTASDVPLTAYAPNPFAWLPFVGVYENTDVFFKIAQVMDRDR